MAICSKCGKHAGVGNNVSFSKRHTKRRFLANLQTIHIMEDGRSVRKIMCTKCIKSLSKVK